MVKGKMRFHIWLHFLQSFVWNGHYIFHSIVTIYSRRFHVWLDSLQSFVWNSTCMFTLCWPYVHIWLYSLQRFVWNRQQITISGPAVCGKLEELSVLSWCTKLLNPILLGMGWGGGGQNTPPSCFSSTILKRLKVSSWNFLTLRSRGTVS